MINNISFKSIKDCPNLLKHLYGIVLLFFFVDIGNVENSQNICLYDSHVVAAIFRIRNTGSDECDDKVLQDLRVLQIWRPKIYEFRK